MFFVLGFSVMAVRFKATLLLYLSVLTALLGVPIFKSILAIRGINHYKNYTLQSKAERRTFIVSFWLIALFAITGLMLCMFDTIPNELNRHATDIHNYTELVLDYSLILVTVSSLLVAVFDLFLLKAIHKKHYDSLIILGESIGEDLVK